VSCFEKLCLVFFLDGCKQPVAGRLYTPTKEPGNGVQHQSLWHGAGKLLGCMKNICLEFSMFLALEARVEITSILLLHFACVIGEDYGKGTVLRVCIY